MASELGGVWRTIRGRRVFIKDGEDLESAMKRSGKFKTKMNEMAVKGAKKEDLKEQYMTSLNNVSEMEYNGEITKDEYDQSIKNINDEYKNRRKDINGRETRAREIDKINSDTEKIREQISNPVEYDFKSVNGKEIKEMLRANETNQYDELHQRTGYNFEDLKNRDNFNEANRLLGNNYEVDAYQSKVFGTDVTKMDKQMKDLFGEDFKYDEDKINQPAGEQTRQLIKEMNVKTFADEIKEQEDKFYTRKDGTKEYDPYKGTRFEKKYDSAEEALNDPNHPTRKYIDEKFKSEAKIERFKKRKGSKKNSHNSLDWTYDRNEL